MLYSTSIPARDIQRKYKDVFAEANKIKRPIVVFAHNKPLGAIIGLDLLEKLQFDHASKKTMEEFKKGEVRNITTSKELSLYFKELDEAAK